MDGPNRWEQFGDLSFLFDTCDKFSICEGGQLEYNAFVQRVAMTVRRPNLALRRWSGLPFMDATIEEIESRILPPSVIVEAGGHDGSDTVRLANTWPGASIHVFEPLDVAYKKLLTTVKDLRNVFPWNLALADSVGEAEFHVSSIPGALDHLPASSSLLPPKAHLDLVPGIHFDQTTTVETVTLDQWATTNGIGEIDFAWLDMQGTEISTLAASPRVTAQLKAVYMEVARKELYAGQLVYQDVVAWMKSAGFSVSIDRVPRTWGNILFVRKATD